MDKSIVKIIALVIIAFFAFLLVVDILNPSYGFFAKVNVGNVGVVERFGKVKEQTLQPGFHITSYFEHIREVDVRTKIYKYETCAFSSDIQQVTMSTSVNYNVSPDAAYKLYTTVGMNYVDSLLVPRLTENIKIVVSKYTAESLISNREKLSAQILELIKNDMIQYGINISAVSINNIDFTDAYENAIETKQVATQEKQRAKTLQEQQTMEAQQAAERDRIKAQAEADVRKINAEAEAYAIKAKAEAEAAANKMINDSITDKLIKYTEIQTWDGKLPNYMGQGSAVPILNVNE